MNNKNNRILRLIFAITILITLVACNNNITNHKPKNKDFSSSVTCHNFPLVSANNYDKISHVNEYLCRDGYLSAYNCYTKEPVYVSYTISYNKDHKIKRFNNFRADEDLPINCRSTLADYKHSGYDRGHLAPYADMNFSYNSANQSFLLSNITPQQKGLNRKGWEKLEQKVRDFAQHSEVYVVTGPVFKDKKVNKTIGNKVAVPEYFFKVIYIKNKDKTLAYLMPNKKVKKKDIDKYKTSVKDIEDKTDLKLSFFNDLKLKDTKLN